jgi:hypothetical protein
MSEPVWVAPDGRVDDVATPVVAAPVPGPAASGAPVAARGAARPPDVPVPLRPMTTGDRLDGAFRILRLAPATVVTLAALAVVPVQLLSVVLLPGAPDPGRAPFEPMLGRAVVTILADDDADRIVRGLVLMALESIALSFVTAGITLLLVGWYTGSRRTTGDVVAGAARRLPALTVAWVLVHLAEVTLGVALVVPALLAMAWGAVAAPIVAAEGRGGGASVRRSFALARRSFAPVLGTCLAVALVDLVLRGALTAVAAAYAGSELPAYRAAVVAVSMAVRLVTVPFVAGAAALLYLDLRVRLEGLDIELAAQERFPVAAP